MVVFGLASARVAKGRDRIELVWFVFGAILGPIALLLLWAAPPGRCRSCMTPTCGWLPVCGWCHEDVRVVPLETRALLAKMAKSRNERDRPLVRDRERPIEDPRPGPKRVEAAKPPAFVLPHFGGLTRPVEGRSPTAVDGPRRTANGRSAMTDSKAIDSSAVATATYITGSAGMKPGHRYIISVDGERLRLLGPVDIDPTVVALDLDIRDVDATSIEGRLLISRPASRSGSAIAFMSVTGTTPDGMATAIVEAARVAARA